MAVFFHRIPLVHYNHASAAVLFNPSRQALILFGHTIESIDFYAASRYESNDPSRTPAKYLAIYESQSEDTAKVQKDGVDWWVKGGFEGPKAMVLRNEVPATRID